MCLFEYIQTLIRHTQFNTIKKSIYYITYFVMSYIERIGSESGEIIRTCALHSRPGEHKHERKNAIDWLKLCECWWSLASTRTATDRCPDAVRISLCYVCALCVHVLEWAMKFACAYSSLCARSFACVCICEHFTYTTRD